MHKNKLKLNPDKTEFLLIGNKCHRKNFTSSFPIDILGNQISPTPTARNLGVIFDSDFNFIPHINSIVKSCNYHMRQFRRIRKHLDRDTAISVANAIVGSRIDYCNSLLYGVHNTYVKKLQRLQNSLACIVTQAPLYTIHPVTKAHVYTSITETVRKLHWLPVWSRIHFKINLITFKAIAHQQPPSLWNILEVREGLVHVLLPTTLPNCGIHSQ